MRCPVMINASRAENVPVNKRGDSVANTTIVAKRFGMDCLNLQPYALKCVLQLLLVLLIFPDDTGLLVWQNGLHSLFVVLGVHRVVLLSAFKLVQLLSVCNIKELNNLG